MEYNLRIWQTDKGFWKVSKTVVSEDGRELTSNTTKSVVIAFEVAQDFIEAAKAREGIKDAQGEVSGIGRPNSVDLALKAVVASSAKP